MRALSLTSIAVTALLALACGVETSRLSGELDTPENQALNALAHERYRALDDAPTTRSHLDAATRQSLFRATYENPVARLDKVPFYDPQGLTGFCFGRAMAAHLAARGYGLEPDAIAKVFIVGDLKQRGAAQTEWRFHVTTAVRGEGGAWYAIDPIFGRVLPVRTWIEETRRVWDTWHLDDPSVEGPQSKVYITHRHAVLPDIRDFSTEETGRDLIELSFVPEGREGFAPRADLGARVFQLSEAATDAYFLTPVETTPADRYDFVYLGFSDGLEIDYNRYFLDLFDTFGPRVAPLSAALRGDGGIRVAAGAAAGADANPLAHVSLDFAKIQDLRAGSPR